MKSFVALALLALVAVSLGNPVPEEQESLSASPVAEERKEVAGAAPVAVAAPADGKDLDTANSYVYGYPYGGYGGYGGYGLGYGGYGGYGLGYGGYYPYYGGYGGYGLYY